MRGTWRTLDGRVLDIKTMSSEHIHNCLAMLKRNGFVSSSEYVEALMSYASLNGEMAQYYAESQVAAMKVAVIIDIMYEELEHRGDLHRKG